MMGIDEVKLLSSCMIGLGSGKGLFRMMLVMCGNVLEELVSRVVSSILVWLVGIIMIVFLVRWGRMLIIDMLVMMMFSVFLVS